RNRGSDSGGGRALVEDVGGASIWIARGGCHATIRRRGSRGLELRPHQPRHGIRDVLRRHYVKLRLRVPQPSRYTTPVRLLLTALDHDERICPVQVFQAGWLEILNREIQNHHVQVRLEELQDTVGFDNDVPAALENAVECWKGIT